MADLPAWLNALAACASILGLLFSLLAWLAARRADRAVAAMRKTLLRRAATADLTAMVEQCGELFRLQQLEQWALLLDRYRVVRRQLTEARRPAGQWEQRDQQVFQRLVKAVGDNQRQIQEALRANRQPDWTLLNDRFQGPYDDLVELAARTHDPEE